jgi:hypothetical protein
LNGDTAEETATDMLMVKPSPRKESEVSQGFEEFIFDTEADSDTEVEAKQEVECESGCFYKGEWDLVNSQRHGKGVMIYADGSKYIGSWKADQACGKGRLVHY